MAARRHDLRALMLYRRGRAAEACKVAQQPCKVTASLDYCILRLRFGHRDCIRLARHGRRVFPAAGDLLRRPARRVRLDPCASLDRLPRLTIALHAC